MSDKPKVIIHIEPGTTKGEFLAAARRAWARYEDALKFNDRARRKSQQQQSDMRARTDVFDLHARLASWDKAAKAIVNPDDPTIQLSSSDRALAERIRPWAMARALGPKGTNRRGSLEALSGRQLYRWANEHLRYESTEEALRRELDRRQTDT